MANKKSEIENKGAIKDVSIKMSSLFPTSNAVSVPEIVDAKSSRGFVLWGEDNKLPQFIWDTYLRCSDLQSLTGTTVDYITGDNIEITKPDYLLTEEDSFEDLIQKIVFDYILFGGFTLEGIRNSKGELVRLNYISVMNVRVDEDLTTAYLSNNWGSWSGKNVITLPLYDKNNKQDHFIFYYRGAITRNINPISIWFSGLKSAVVLNEIRNYNLHNITNNFSANFAVVLNGATIKQAELAEMKEKLSAGYTGTDNAGRTLIINNSNSEGKVELVRLDADKCSDLYHNTADSSVSDLQRAFRINPMLIGENVQTGFSKQEYQQCYALYKHTVVGPLRNNICKELKKVNIDVKFNDPNIDFSD